MSVFSCCGTCNCVDGRVSQINLNQSLGSGLKDAGESRGGAGCPEQVGNGKDKMSRYALPELLAAILAACFEEDFLAAGMLCWNDSCHRELVSAGLA